MTDYIVFVKDTNNVDENTENLINVLNDKGINFEVSQINNKLIESGFDSEPILKINNRFYSYIDALNWLSKN
jgi:hypothetical protein